MVIFAGAALAAFFLSTLLPHSEDRRWSVQAWHGGIGFTLLILMLFAVVALSTDWLGYWAFRLVQPLRRPEAVHLFFGTVFGITLRFWAAQLARPRPQVGKSTCVAIAKPSPEPQGKQLPSPAPEDKPAPSVLAGPPRGEAERSQANGDQPSFKGYNWSAVLLIALLVFGVVGPYSDDLIRRLSSLKTAFGEATFVVTKAEQRLEVGISRDSYSTASLQNIQTLPRIILTFDLPYLSLVVGPSATAGETEQQRRIYADTARFIKEILLPLVMCADQAVSANQDIESVRHELRPVAQGLRRLIQTDPPIGRAPHSAFLRTVLTGRDAILKLVDKPAGCPPIAPKIWPDNLLEVTALAKGPHLHLVLAYLLWFNQNIEGATTLLASAAKKFPDDMKLNYYLARLMYQGEHDLQSILPYDDKVLRVAEDMDRKIEHRLGRVSSADDREKLQQLKAALERTKRTAKNSLAYLAAQARVEESMARRYARENFEVKGLTRVEIAAYTDTYGFVKMIFAAEKDPPDFNEIHEARKLFEEAMFYAKGLSLSEAIRTVQNHISLAEKFLKQRP